MLETGSMETLVFLVGMAGLIIVSLLLIGLSQALHKRNMNKYYTELDALTKAIEEGRKEVEKLEHEVTSKSIDRSIGLTQAANDALNLYEQSNIRIPADIIEDLAQRKPTDLTKAFVFIEVQRNHWKLENSKKVYKGGSDE